MRKVWYITFWSSDEWPTGLRRKPLPQFLLDIPYCMDDGVILPLSELNKCLAGGGSRGGMSPGTSWRGFTIDEAEYEELVQALLSLDVEDARRKDAFIDADVQAFRRRG